VPLGALLEHPRQAQPDSHEGRRESYRVGPMRQSYERLSTTFKGSQLNAVKVLMMEGYSSEWVAHGGDEFVYVLSGQVRYTLRKKDYPLRAGDSLHFDANERHRVVNAGPGPAELIVVGTLPLFDDHQSAFAPTSGESKPKARAKAVKKESKGPTAVQDKAAPAPRKSNSITGKTTKPAAARRRT
jgi:quercetin dioxygenase-like cupin family protein